MFVAVVVRVSDVFCGDCGGIVGSNTEEDVEAEDVEEAEAEDGPCCNATRKASGPLEHNVT